MVPEPHVLAAFFELENSQHRSNAACAVQGLASRNSMRRRCVLRGLKNCYIFKQLPIAGLAEDVVMHPREKHRAAVLCTVYTVRYGPGSSAVSLDHASSPH